MKVIKSQFETLSFNSAKELKKYLKTVKIMPRTTNRDIKEGHVVTMKLAILERGIKRAINVIKTDAFGEGIQYYMEDGQHLREAILDTPDKDLKGFFLVFVETVESAEDCVLGVASLNTTSKNWSINDHFKSFLGLLQFNPEKYQSYARLKEVQNETGLELTGLIEAYGNTNDVSHMEFKKGEFIFNELQGNKIVSIYEEAVKSGLDKRGSSFRAVVRFVRANPNLNVKAFFKGISLNPMFSKSFSRDRYISMFQSIKK